MAAGAGDTKRFSAAELRAVVSGVGAAPESGAAAGSPPDGIGSCIGGYTLGRRLGRGGMADVYLATDSTGGGQVAVKVVREDHALDDEHLGRFVREARLASRLRHSSIVRVYDTGWHAGRPYIVQEYIDGGDVEDLISTSPSGKVPVDRAVAITIGVAGALKAASKRGIVHRDIKPANILLTREGLPKLVDLGIAKQLFSSAGTRPRTGMTSTHTTLGCPLYVAPEQIVDSRAVDIRADIYSLGVTLYRMLTGELPYAAVDAKEMLLKHLCEDTPDPREVESDVGGDLAAVVLRMLAKAPDERYQTPSRLLRALKRVARRRRRRSPDSQGSAAGVSGFLNRLRRFVLPGPGQAAPDG